MSKYPIHPDDQATREEVYAAIDSEREYQRVLWNPSTTPTGGRHSVAEFMVYMQEYMAKARTVISSQAEPKASAEALEHLRKVITLGVTCLEQNGAPFRVLPESK